MDANQITVCPNNVRHHFRDMRSKSKAAGPPWTYFSRCTRCTAMLMQVVGTKQHANGDVVPTMTSYLLTSKGSVPIDSSVERIDDPGKQP